MKGSIYDIERECRNLVFDRVAIDLEHFERLRTLPLHHQDPFDRLIVAQALAGGFTLISSDHVMPQYGISCIW